MGEDYGLNRSERACLRKLRTPVKVQAFLDDAIAYNKEPDGETCRSPRRVLRDRVAHCMEGALLAAAALRLQGRPPLIVDMEAERDDDHLIAVFREDGHWGAVAKSNYSGLRFRDPVYRSVRELVMSYYPHYYNLAGEMSLRTYSRPVDLGRFDRIEWMTTESELWPISEYLWSVRHDSVLPPGFSRRRRRVDQRLFHSGLLGSVG